MVTRWSSEDRAADLERPNRQHGLAYIFVRNGTEWSEEQILRADDGEVVDSIGISVAISGDTVILGNHRGANDLEPGSPSAGSAFVACVKERHWSNNRDYQTRGDEMAGDDFGFSVAITAILRLLGPRPKLRGAPRSSLSATARRHRPRRNCGLATASRCSTPLVILSASAAITPSSAHLHVLVGAAYIFVGGGASWLHQAKLVPGELAGANSFGQSVAISGDRAIVGANLPGKVYVYKRSVTSWAEQQILPPAGGAGRSNFGHSVGISGDTIVVGGDLMAYVFQTPDTDGDGLPDEWESSGITVNSTGRVVGTGNLAGQGTFINLPAMGADPLHKDLFVHADYMQQDPMRPTVNFKPLPRALKLVADAFATAPVENPDLKPGINLHVDNGRDSIMKPGATWGDLSESGDVPFETTTGVYSDPPANDNYDWSAIDAAKLAHFGPAGRSAVFHYALFCNNYAGSDSSGLSRGIPANDFIVALGDIGGGTLNQQAGTFMHEFGHNLGLLHGGGDDINNKPNYLSIMNYAFQMQGLLKANGRRGFDYSRAALDTLDEFALDENVGINDPALHFTLFSRFSRANNPPGSNRCLDRDRYYSLFFPSRALDWDCDGVRAAAPYPSPGPNPDINDDGTCVTASGATLNSGLSGDDEFRAIRVTDSTLRRIVAGPDHICQSLAVAGDRQTRPINYVEPNLLPGFKDWPALVFVGDGKIGNAEGASIRDQMSSPADEWTINQILDVVPQSLRDEELVAPLEVVSYSPPTGAAPLVVNFDGGASTAVNGTIVSWSWDFGDGTTGSGATVAHTYNTPGDYFASLTVTDNNGHVNLTPLLNRVVVTDGPPPTPTPTATPTPAPTATPTPGPGDIDSTYDATVTRHHAEAVYAAITQPDGKIIVGGEFESFGGCASRNIARVNPDGRCDPTFDPGLAMTNVFQVNGGPVRVDLPVKALAQQLDGKILVGVCECYSPNTSSSRRNEMIFRLNPDGALDTSFNAGAVNSPPVIPRLNAIVVQPDGKILIGGIFTYDNNGPRVGVARLNVDGSVDSSFTLPNGGGGFGGPMAGGSPGTVTALTLQSDGKILIGGFFDRIGSNSVFHLARLNSDGSLDLGFNSFNPQTGLCASGFVFPVSEISAFALQPDSKILLSGRLSTGSSLATVARLNSDGSRDAGYVPPLLATNTLALQSDGKVWIGGDFQITTPVVRNSIARLNTDGTLDMTFDGPGINSVSGQKTVYAIAFQVNGKVVVVGSFDTFNSAPVESILQFNADGSRDQAFDSNGPGRATRVYTMVRQPDGKMLVGFDGFTVSAVTKLNSARRGGIGRLNADGTTDTTFTSPFDAESHIFGIALQADGKVILGGSVRLIGSQDVIEFARLNANGTLDTGFVPPNEPGVHLGSSGGIAIQPDGKILVNQASSGQGSLVRLNANGSRDSTFVVPLGVGGVSRIVFQPDQKILITGFFIGIGGTNTRIARINTDGSFDASFEPGIGPDNAVQELVLQPDGKVLIGGWFLNYNGTPRPCIARLNPDGRLDTSFMPVNPNSDQFQNPRQVSALALQSDGKLVVGSDHQAQGSGAPNRVFRLNSDGNVDPSFPLRAGIEGVSDNVNEIIVQPDSTIIIGGGFNVVNGVARLALARLLGTTESTPTPTPTPNPTPTRRHAKPDSNSGANTNTNSDANSSCNYRPIQRRHIRQCRRQYRRHRDRNSDR